MVIIKLQWLGDDKKIDSFAPEAELYGTPDSTQSDKGKNEIGIELFFGH